MQAIDILAPGGPENLVASEHPDPSPGPGEVRIRVRASGVNRPDVLQRQGKYAPPPGTTSIPGLEVAGEIDEVGPDVARWRPGDRVCALVGGGGYAELCVAPEGQCLRIPENVSFSEAGAAPETWLTVWSNVFELGQLKAGQMVLVHGGSSGIGHTAIQLAKARGSRVVSTSSTEDKADFCRRMGADLALNASREDFVERVEAFSDGQGVDVILDMAGGDYLSRNLKALAFGGRVVHIAFLRGAKAEVSLPTLMAKQAILTGSFLRRRSSAEKARLTQAVETAIWPLLATRQVVPQVHRTFPLADAAAAHACMEEGNFFGKLVLEV